MHISNTIFGSANSINICVMLKEFLILEKIFSEKRRGGITNN